MAQRLVVYSAECCKIPRSGNGNKHVILGAFYDTPGQQRQNVLLQITHFHPSLLFLLKDQSQASFEFDNDLSLGQFTEDFNSQHGTRVLRASFQKAIPAIGFTNGIQHTLLQLFFEHDNQRKSIRDAIVKSKHFGPVELHDQVIHSELSATKEFMFEHNIQFQSPSLLSNLVHRAPPSFATVPLFEVNALHRHLQPDLAAKEETVTLSCMSFGMVAHCSSATSVNNCAANATNPNDHIFLLGKQVDDGKVDIYQVDNFLPIEDEPKELTLKEKLEAEAGMLNHFHGILHQAGVQIMAFATDQPIIPHSPVEYVESRVKIINQTLGRRACWFCWSSLIGHENYKRQSSEGEQKSTFNFPSTYPGLELLDVTKRLKGTLLKPPLTGYTLLHAVRHPKLIKSQPQFAPLQNLDYVFPTHFNSTPEEQLRDLHIRIEIVAKLASETGFIANISAVSKLTHECMTNIVERGEQNRIFSAFLHKWHKKYYLNRDILNRAPLTVPKTTAESSIPDPTWYLNPDVNSFSHKNPPTRTQPPRPAPRPKVKAASTFGGGLVLDPMPGFYEEPERTVFTLDWNSMYPNIIKKWKICPMTLVCDMRWIQDPKAEFLFIPCSTTACVVFMKTYDGNEVVNWLAELESEFLQARERARELGNKATEPREKFAHKNTENGCKTTANAVYGFFGAKKGKISLLPIALTIPRIGQHMQQYVRQQVLLGLSLEDLGMTLEEWAQLCHTDTTAAFDLLPARGAIIGGDTDSVFTIWQVPRTIQDPAEKRAFGKRCAQATAKKCSVHFHPCKIIMENELGPFWMEETKKTYIAKHVGGAIMIKGNVCIKRDKCDEAKNVVQKIIDHIINQKKWTLSEFREWFTKQMEECFPWKTIETLTQLAPFVLSAELSSDYKNLNSLPPRLATLIQRETGVAPLQGERMSYVVAFYDDNALLHVDRIQTPKTFLEKKQRLDIQWYIDTQLMGCLRQLLCLDIHHAMLVVAEDCARDIIGKWRMFNSKKRTMIMCMKVPAQKKNK